MNYKNFYSSFYMKFISYHEITKHVSIWIEHVSKPKIKIKIKIKNLNINIVLHHNKVLNSSLNLYVRPHIRSYKFNDIFENEICNVEDVFNYIISQFEIDTIPCIQLPCKMGNIYFMVKIKIFKSNKF
jgi:hypothetical protein